MRRLALVLVTLTLASLTWAAPPDIPEQPLISRLHEQEAAMRADAWQRAALTKSWVPELPPSAVDAIRYSLDVHLDLQRRVLSGTVEAELAAVQDGLGTITLDADQVLRVLSVVLLSDVSRPHDSPVSLPFTHRDDLLSATLPRPLAAGERVRLLVSYGGRASSPDGGVVWTSHNSGASPLVYTFAEPFEARVWWPCNDRPDDKAVVDLAVTAPEAMVVSSNGLQVGRVVNADGTATTRWSSAYPVATYLVVMNASDHVYSELTYETQDGGTMPVVLYAYPEHDAQARADLAVTPEMIGVLADAWGEYPFVEEKYGNCVTPFGGGMEHQTLTTLAAGSIGSAGVDWLNVHELGHSWWGDWVTCADWKDLWLNEGFATYSELFWAEQTDPDLAAQWLEDSDWRGYFLGPVYDCPYAFSSTVYEKGAWVLRMLRRLLGDNQFFAAIAAYRAAYAGSSATTAGLQTVLEDATGTDLDWFFEQWVYGENRPRLRYGWSEVSGPAVRLVVRQEQTNAPLFRMPLDVRVTTVGGVVDAEVWVEAEREQTFDIPLTGAPTAVAVDPDHHLLRELAPMDEPDMELGALYPDRYDAGTVAIGSTAIVTVPVTNVGGSTLVLQSVDRVSGDEFSLVSPASFPVEIAPGATSNLEIRYRARYSGPRTGTFYVTSNDPSRDGAYLRVKGTGLLWPEQYLRAPALSLAFGAVPVGSSAVEALSVSNLGGQDLALAGTLTGDAFELLDSFPSVLPPNTAREIRLRFTPTAAGPASGTFSLTTNDPYTPQTTTALTGEGIPAPRLAVEPGALLFGAATEPLVSTLALTNAGAAELVVSDLVAADPFELADPWSLPRTLAPGESATLAVRFNPPVAGEVRGQLRILSDDPALPWAAVPLAGRGAMTEPMLQAFPAVAQTPGLGGATWSSDVVLVNPTADDLAVDLVFLPEDAAVPDLSLTVPSGQQRLLVGAVAALGRDGAGGLELAAAASGLVATSTTFTTEGSGTYGQGIPSLPVEAALSCGQTLVLAGLAGNGGFHTNIGLLNLGATELRVDFALHAADGTHLGSRPLVAAPRAFAQASEVIAPLTSDTVRGGFAVLTCDVPDAAYLAYASVVDDGSHDPTFVAPVVVDSTPLDVVLPAVAHTPGFAGTRWRTDVTVVNTGSAAAQVALELHPRDGGPTLTASAPVAAGASAFLPDVVGDLAAGASTVGWMRLTSDGGDLVVGSRTYNDDPVGTYGQGIPAVPATGLLGPGDRAVVPALAEDGGHRTNLGLASTASVDITVRVSVRREDGTPVGDLDVPVPAGALVQLDRVLSSRFGYAGRAWALVWSDDPDARYTAYASVVDEGTGDPVYVPAVEVPAAR